MSAIGLLVIYQMHQGILYIIHIHVYDRLPFVFMIYCTFSHQYIITDLILQFNNSKVFNQPLFTTFCELIFFPLAILFRVLNSQSSMIEYGYFLSWFATLQKMFMTCTYTTYRFINPIKIHHPCIYHTSMNIVHTYLHTMIVLALL